MSKKGKPVFGGSADGPVVWVGIIVTTCLILIVAENFLWLVLPMLIAIVLYYLTQPLVLWTMSHGWSRQQSVLMATALHVVFVAALFFIIVPLVLQQSAHWRDTLGHGLDSVLGEEERIQTILSHYNSLHIPKPVPHTSATQLEMEQWISTQVNSPNAALQILHWVPSVLLIPYFTYFSLLDGGRFKHFIVRSIPNAFFERTLELFFEIDAHLRRYFQGLIIFTTLDATLLSIGLAIVGINYPIALGVVCAVMAWIPYLGWVSGCLMVVFVAAAQSQNSGWPIYESIGLFIFVRMINDMFFIRLTVGSPLRLHRLVTVVGVLLGGAVAGGTGLLLVMPVLAVVTAAGRMIGVLLSDERIMARHRYAMLIRRRRARFGLDDADLS